VILLTVVLTVQEAATFLSLSKTECFRIDTNGRTTRRSSNFLKQPFF
jgi:hypothetical protein